MSNEISKECETPLIDLLVVPLDARMIYKKEPTSSRNIPVGVLCKCARDEILRLTAALSAESEQNSKYKHELEMVNNSFGCMTADWPDAASRVEKIKWQSREYWAQKESMVEKLRALSESLYSHTSNDSDYQNGVIAGYEEAGLALNYILGAEPAKVDEPTDAMLAAARDWSQKKYGKPIGNDAATGCWNAMRAAQ